ncbi:ATP-dependent nuclease [Maribacter aquivivus]|uniref:ATP-dependent nuclease n=1 Tax=Maribacter aquivivus TaxID=228958 RepID=UPI002490D71E|nr:ATP-dependent endonuclease [Maribacter aquivivus]
MYIKSISINNFRLLKNSTIELNNEKKQDLSLLIGKNNSGKTSFIVLFDKFFNPESSNWGYNDFSLSIRKQILKLSEAEDLTPISIQMKLEINYSKQDNLENISDFILDLNPEENVVKLLFERSIDIPKLRKTLTSISTQKNKERFIIKNLGDYLIKKYYAYYNDDDLLPENSGNLVEKTIADIKKVINFQVIHAKRNVSSSESSGNNKTALSELASKYFNKENSFSQEAFGSINDTILEMDEKLNKQYNTHFKDYFDNVKEFIDDGKGELNIISNLESKEVLSNSSKIVYGNSSSYLPENQNGLGHLNILYLLLQIEVKRKIFEQEKKDINLLFIEEPEAHTHPQMQYIFAKRVKDILNKIPNSQTFITSHSSHIVSQCDFEDIRYFKVSDDNVLIKNFHKELQKKYISEPKHFQFIKQYLTLYTSELFFAEKIIFIEGLSEKLLLPYFIQEYDESRKSEENYIPLTSKNISFVQVGANAKVFQHFIEFLDIKTLIFTDIDTTKYDEDSKRWKACSVDDGSNTSNTSIKHYLKAPDKELKTKEPITPEFKEWISKLKKNTNNSISNKVNVSYQLEENNYQGRSFEDAFVSVNLDLLVKQKTNILGLKNIKTLTSDRTDFYDLTEEVLDKKSDFASSILYLALTENVKWKTPNYIVNGLNWISE